MLVRVALCTGIVLLCFAAALIAMGPDRLGAEMLRFETSLKSHLPAPSQGD